MTFSITDSLFDQIIAALDNQEVKYFVDAKEGVLVEASAAGSDKDRFYELPEWNSASGFKLREDFTATVRIPLVKEKLQEEQGNEKSFWLYSLDDQRAERQLLTGVIFS